jgi:salicylate hydroxylase
LIEGEIVSKVERIVIIGAGIGGLTAACALRQNGFEVEVYERSPELGEVGAGLQIGPNAVKVLNALGLEDRLRRIAAEPDETVSVRWDDASLRYREPLKAIAQAEYGARYLTAHRADLHRLLIELLPESSIRLGRACVGAESAGRGAVARFADGGAVEADLVVGADGIRSAVRALLFGRSEPVFTGFANWRVTLPKPPEVDSITWMTGRGKSLGVIPIAADHLYLAGVSKEPGNPRYDRRDLPRLMREKFAEFGGAAPPLLAQVQLPEQVVYTAIEEVTQPAPWYRGRVVLVGDAVHASSPFWAQGGSMAIEDVIVLAELVATGRPAAEILPEWQARRYDRAVWVQRGSLETGERGHREGPGVYEAMTAFLAAHMLNEVAARYAKFAEPI